MADPRDLVVEANERFWKLTGYKRGKRLSRSDPADVRMMPVWMDVYRQVANERLGSSGRPVSAPALPAAPSPVREQPGAREPVQAESAGMSGPLKGALIAGGVVVAGLLGKFLFTEVKYYGIAKSLERKSKAPRRSKATG
jgi:hypothetical protein